jgi:MSHA biogenesis protein MshQ
MSLLFKLLNVIFIIQQVISTTDVKYYTTPGNYTVTIPADSSGVTMSMWGAGGAGTGIKFSGGGMMYPGGSGAFVSCTINALPGSTIYLIVGGGGAVGNFGQSTTSSAIGGGGQSAQMLLYTCVYIHLCVLLLNHFQYIKCM